MHAPFKTRQLPMINRWLMLLVCVCCSSSLYAQTLGIDLNNDIAVEANGPDEWLMTRWSWLHEWEMHNAAYLREPSLIVPPAQDKDGEDKKANKAAGVAGTADQPSLEVLTKTAVQSLVASSQRGLPRELRVQATLALGRIGNADAVTRLLQLLNDQDDAVGEVAWMALGLAHTQAAREKLLDPGTLSSRQTLGWVVAIALMDKPPENVLRTLAVLVKQDRDMEVARMALWAMSVHNPPGLLDAARVIAKQSFDPIATSQALLILGKNQQTVDLSLLKGVMLTRGRGILASTDAIVQSVTSETPAIETNQQGATLSAIRASAAIALGQYVIAPEDKYSQRARGALRDFFEAPPVPLVPAAGVRFRSDFTHSAALSYEIRFAASSLGRIGYGEDAQLLVKILRTRSLSDYRGRLTDARFFLRRGHAALALGNYLRRMTQLGIQIEPTDIPDATDRSATGDAALWRNRGPLEGESADQTRYAIRKALRGLIDTASDPQEPYDLRAACVLALGVSNSPARTIDIRNILKSRGGQDHVVAAYGVLALGLLGDTDTLTLAAKLLNQKPTKPITADALIKHGYALTYPPGQRVTTQALLEAIGKIESHVAVELARQTFGRERWTSRQAALTLRLLGDVSLVQPLSELLDRYPELAKSQSGRGVQAPARPTAAQTAAITAWSLGQLLRPDLDDRLALVFNQLSNYTLPLAPVMQDAQALRRDNAMYRFRCYADPLFYESLAPCLPPRVGIRFRF